MPSRRILISRGAFVAASAMGLSLTTICAARASAKMSKQAADYQDQPHDGEVCSACCMFVPGNPDQCTMIGGVISPHGWCKLWQAGPNDTCN